MASMSVTAEFEDSYRGFSNYPLNIIEKDPYASSDQGRRDRFDLAARSLLTEPPTGPVATNPTPTSNPIYVVFRDWDTVTNKFARENAFGDRQLKSWLGDRTNYAATQPASIPSIALTKADPQCRFIFLWAEHSRDRLKVSQDMLLRIFSYHQVMPVYLDFISVFGMKPDTDSKTFGGRDLRFTGFQTRNAMCSKRAALASHGRSGRSFEICYNLKMAARTGVASDGAWSVRQAALYHQFDVETGRTVWISTKARLTDMKEKIELLTGPKGLVEDRSYGSPLDCFRSSLAVHLLFCHWSLEGWRGYIEHLENNMEKISQAAVLHPVGSYHSKEYAAQDLQNLQRATEKAHEAIMIMEGNVDVMVRLQAFYTQLIRTDAFLLGVDPQSQGGQPVSRELGSHLTWLNTQVEAVISDIRMHTSRARLLVSISADRSRLILQQLQGRAAEETLTMTVVSIEETVVMRVVTVVTVIFLPATFVSTFFSTDIVKYQGDGNADGNFSAVALQRWLEVTLVLTFIVLVITWCIWRWAKSRRPHLLPLYMSARVESYFPNIMRWLSPAP